MFNVDKPSLHELHSLSQLRRSAFAAVIGLVLIFITIVLPAEYGIDPTSVGRMLGLTEMGEIKQELHDEAEQDHQQNGDSQSLNFMNSVIGIFAGSAHAEELWKDTITFTIEPGDHRETKLAMNKGDHAQYLWTSSGGRINFDLHAHGDTQSKTYEKGRGATEGEGGFVAPFKGEHGWFWRNRDKGKVTITLKINGTYHEVVQ